MSSKLTYLKDQNTPNFFEATVKKCFEQKTELNKFSGKMETQKCCIFEWNGTEYYHYIKEKSFGVVSEGKKVNCVKKQTKEGKNYLELYPPASPTTQTPIIPHLAPDDMPWEQRVVESTPDMQVQTHTNPDQKRNERILKSQCLNLAAELYGNGTASGTCLLEDAKKLYDVVKDWINS